MSWYGTAADTTGIAIQPPAYRSLCLDIARLRSRSHGVSYASSRKARRSVRPTMREEAQNQAMQRTRDKI